MIYRLSYKDEVTEEEEEHDANTKSSFDTWHFSLKYDVCVSVCVFPLLPSSGVNVNDVLFY